MKALVILIIFTLSLCPVKSQTVVHITHRHYEGTIFPKHYDLFGFPPDGTRYSPSETDIDMAEHILSMCFKEVTCKSKRMHYKRDIIKKRKLKRYYRLYWGEFNGEKDKIIGIVFDSNYKNHKSMEDEIYSVFGGGPSFFVVKINITKPKIVSIKLNGYS